MNTFTQSVAKSLGRHFVTLSCVYTPRGGHEQSLVNSGFMIDVAGEWFYVTAGHVVESIRAAISAGGTFDVWRFGDQTAGNKFANTSVPFEFELGDWLVLTDHKIGLDYAAIHVREFYRRQLQAGGVMAIANDAWSDHTTESDYWALVGIPAESVTYDGVTIINARVVLAPLTPADPPPMADRKAENQFYAKLADGSEQFVNDVAGMSGGPVFSLKKRPDGTWRYNVVGVQSAWYKSIRTIAACPFSSFGQALEDMIEMARRHPTHTP